MVENRPSKSDPRLVAEWGLSLHIAFNGHDILFDTGTSGSFADNAKHLSVNIASVDTAVLSHHHFDHGGGLKRFLDLNSSAKVNLGETPNGDCYIKIFRFVKKYIGLDKALMSNYPDRFETITKLTQTLPDVFLIPHMLDTYPKPVGNKNIFLKRDRTFKLDEFAHEIIMAIKENGKLVIFTGCSHSGILNMVDTVAREFRGVPVKAVIGGLHLISAPPFNFMAGKKREVEELGRSILHYPIDETYTGHCTGTQAFRVLKAVMGNHLRDVQTGSSFEV